jgi:hypothetical protein
MFSIAGVGLKEGSPSRDIDGNGCGYNDTVADYPFIFIKDGSNFMDAACVKNCPNF